MSMYLRKPVLYPNHYTWFVLVSAIDVMLTWTILYHFRGREVNGVANAVLLRLGYRGLIAFKFALVVLVICICEIVGRHRLQTGRRLAQWAVGLTCFPLVAALWQLWGVA